MSNHIDPIMNVDPLVFARMLVQLGLAATLEDAEQFCQDGAVKMWEAHLTGKKIEHPYAFVKTCIVRVAIDAARKRGVRFVALPPDVCDEHEVDRDTVNRDASVRSALQGLDDEEFTALVLNTVGGIAFERIGVMIDKSTATACRRWRAAKDKLAAHLGEP